MLSEVTCGWMFIFRALNYLTTALTLRVCACVSLSQRESARCGPLFHTYQSSSRGQCVQKEIMAERK